MESASQMTRIKKEAGASSRAVNFISAQEEKGLRNGLEMSEESY